MMGTSIGLPKVNTSLSEKEENHSLEEFEKEEESVFPPSGESLVEFLSKKQKVEKEVMLRSCCSAMFDRSAAEAFEASEILESTRNKG